jgi:hypothetical protein
MSLNDRLKALSAGGDVDYTPKHVAINDAQSLMDRAMAAYEADLAPPADVLRRTFGVMYERRTNGHPDSIAYVFDTYKIGPITMCKAWKIVEHPAQPVNEVGPVAGSAGIGGGVVTNANSSVVRHDNGGRPDVSVVQFPCSPKSYTAVAPGSIRTPLPRHPDAAGAVMPPAQPTPMP